MAMVYMGFKSLNKKMKEHKEKKKQAAMGSEDPVDQKYRGERQQQASRTQPQVNQAPVRRQSVDRQSAEYGEQGGQGYQERK